jgi:hypothetical protein
MKKNSIEVHLHLKQKNLIQIQAIYSLDFCFSFHPLFSIVWTYIVPKLHYTFFIEINFESKSKFSFSNLFEPKMNLKQPRNLGQKTHITFVVCCQINHCVVTNNVGD